MSSFSNDARTRAARCCQALSTSAVVGDAVRSSPGQGKPREPVLGRPNDENPVAPSNGNTNHFSIANSRWRIVSRIDHSPFTDSVNPASPSRSARSQLTAHSATLRSHACSAPSASKGRSIVRSGYQASWVFTKSVTSTPFTTSRSTMPSMSTSVSCA